MLIIYTTLLLYGCMSLRERMWRQHLHINKKRKLPKIHKRYIESIIWEEQQLTIDIDLARMPQMHRGNVFRLIQRHAATTPWHPYTQGHLYLIYIIALVLRGEKAIYWGYSRLCHSVYRYGPDTPYDTTVVPNYVYNAIAAELDVCRKLFDVAIRMRWLYIMFGQTFTTPDTICIIWDYLLLGTSNMHRFSCVLLQHALAIETPTHNQCSIERFNHLVGIKINCPTLSAELIARAQALSINE